MREGLDINEFRQVFSQLIEQIGLSSAGGDSVEDIRMERKKNRTAWYSHPNQRQRNEK